MKKTIWYAHKYRNDVQVGVKFTHVEYNNDGLYLGNTFYTWSDFDKFLNAFIAKTGKPTKATLKNMARVLVNSKAISKLNKP